MDTMNDKPNRNWSELTADARRAEPTAVDVQHAVMSEIRKIRTAAGPQPSLSLLAAVDALMTRGWVRPALATTALAACGIGYGGYRGSALVDMVNALVL